MWKIEQRFGKNIPDNIVYEVDGVRQTYFWDSKRDEWSIFIESFDEKNGLWFIKSIDKAPDDWYVRGETPIGIAEWVFNYLKEREEDDGQ